MSSVESTKIRLFSPVQERLQLAAPLVPIALASWEILARPEWKLGEQAWIRFLSNVVFFNGLHVVLTFALILGMPSLRNWVGQRYGVSVRAWGVRMLLLGLLLAAIFWAGGAYFVVESPWRRSFTLLLLLLGISAPNFHSLWQIRGLSLLYEEKWRQTGEVTADVDRRVRQGAERERKLLNLFFVSFVAMQAAHLVAEGPRGLPLLGWMQIQLESAALGSTLRAALVALNAVLALAMLANAAFSPSADRTHKPVYLMRLVLYPMSGYSLLAFAGLSALHGLEYLSVFWRVSDKAPAPQRRRVRWTGAAFMAALLPCLLPQFLVLWGIWEPSSLLQAVAAVGIATVYVHYVVDRAVYRMRDPATRSAMGPLLL